MKKIKVLEIVDSIQYGGMEQFVYNVISKTDLNQYDFSIITTGKRYVEAEKRFENLGVKIYGLPLKKENFIKYLYMLNKIICKGKFDIVHSHVNFYSFIPLFISKIHKVKLNICHVHGLMPELKKIEIMEYLTSKFADVRYSCSKEAGYRFYKNFKFETLCNGIDVDRFEYNSSKREKLRKKYKIKNDEIVIGHIGRFYPVKNHKFIVEIFNEVSKKNEKFKLIFVGDGELLVDIKNEVTKKNLDKKVIFLEPTDNVDEYYQMFDLFILPSISEGLGLVTIEAQCSGLDCIVSTGVPNDVNINKRVKFISLENKELWIDSILNYKITNIRFDGKKILIDSEYNINNTVKRLNKVYLSIKKESD